MVLGLSIVVLPGFSTSETVIIENNKITMAITIVDAYYTELDGDGIQNDVVSHFNLNFTNDQFTSVFYDLDFSLILPSGINYSYHYAFSTTEYDLAYVVSFFNHATESGWYTFGITGTIYQGGTATGAVDLIFDPPGGTGGGDPLHVNVTGGP